MTAFVQRHYRVPKCGERSQAIARSELRQLTECVNHASERARCLMRQITRVHGIVDAQFFLLVLSEL